MPSADLIAENGPIKGLIIFPDNRGTVKITVTWFFEKIQQVSPLRFAWVSDSLSA